MLGLRDISGSTWFSDQLKGTHQCLAWEAGEVVKTLNQEIHEKKKRFGKVEREFSFKYIKFEEPPSG